MVTVEVAAIGDEVVKGYVANTNGAFISQRLLEGGFDVVGQRAIGDAPETLKRGLADALAAADVVVATGGLGPTCDDGTRAAAAALFDAAFHRDDAVAAELERRYGAALPSLADQAMVPDKAQALINRVGTAPGLIFEEGGKTLILVPGVPGEMREMVVEQVLPYLRRRFPSSSRSYCRTLSLGNMSESSVDPTLRAIVDSNPAVKVGIYPGMGLLQVRLTTTATDEDTAKQLLDPAVALLLQRFGDRAFESSSGAIEEAVHNVLIASGATVSVAESCTGGAIARQLVATPGASAYFLGSVVAYSCALKKTFLGVKDKTLADHGAVSEKVVEEMLRGILQQTGSTWAVAVSGVAGPNGGTATKPVGTVVAGIQHTDAPPYLWTMHLQGSREMIIQRSSNLVLFELYRKICALS